MDYLGEQKGALNGSLKRRTGVDDSEQQQHGVGENTNRDQEKEKYQHSVGRYGLNNMYSKSLPMI